MARNRRRLKSGWLDLPLAVLAWAAASVWLGHHPGGIEGRADRIARTLRDELARGFVASADLPVATPRPIHERDRGNPGAAACADTSGLKLAGPMVWPSPSWMPSLTPTEDRVPASERDGCLAIDEAAVPPASGRLAQVPAGSRAYGLALSITLQQNALIVLGLASALLLRRAWLQRRTFSALTDLTACVTQLGSAARPEPLVFRPMPELASAFNTTLERFSRQQAELRNFVWDAAHQLRTPLAVLSARLSSGLVSSDVQAVRGDLEWMSRLVGQILTLARAAELPIDTDRTFDLTETTIDVVAALAPLAIHRDRDIELVGAERAIPVRGNPELAVEAISNLVENALSHTPSGTTVTVALRRPGHVSVSDLGKGVPVGEREQIFRRFAQGGRPTKGGAGLGLAIVADIMRRHGGTVSCQDRDGGGAVFALAFRPALSRDARSQPSTDGTAGSTFCGS